MTATPGQQIKDLALGRWLVLNKVPEGGSLVVRQLRSGATFYWRHTDDGQTERVHIGLYDSSAPPKSLKPSARGYSVQAALQRARELAMDNNATPGGLRAVRASEAAAKAQEAELQSARTLLSLKALCAEYVAHLKRLKKRTWRAVELTFKGHLEDAFPDLVAKPAADVEKRELVVVLRRLMEKGQTSTARKLRAYLHAAYACASRADSDPTLPAAFVAFAVIQNPLTTVAPVRGKADKNPLRVDELRLYWRKLQSRDGVIGAALRLHVLTGGQRPAQLVRVNERDIQDEVIRIIDEKGRRAEPRVHLLPITKEMRKELDILLAVRKEADRRRLEKSAIAVTGSLFSTDGGQTTMRQESLLGWGKETATEAGIRDFQLKRVRSGIETLLAAARVPKDVRGQLQSHGIGGVQDTHYDDHDYLPEKKEALEKLLLVLNSGNDAPASGTPPPRPDAIADPVIA